MRFAQIYKRALWFAFDADWENCRSLGFPGFPVEVGGAASSMRFSLQKTAHAALSSAASRKSGYARRL